MIEDEAESINEAIIKREKAKKSGNEVEAKEIEELLKGAGFEIIDSKDSTTVKRKKDNLQYQFILHIVLTLNNDEGQLVISNSNGSDTNASSRGY